MAKIRNTSARNIYGDGYEQEITLDNGEQYIVKNSSARNIYGDGYEKEIVKKGTNSSDNSFQEFIVNLILGLLGLGFLWFCLETGFLVDLFTLFI